MKKEYSPVRVSEVYHFADIAKKLPRDDAEKLQYFLMKRVFEAGAESDEVNNIISSITDRFVDEDNEMRRKAIEDELRRNGTVQQETIEADDHQIVKAIKKALPKFQSDRDWGGIYRILVDYCNFPAEKTKFTIRFWNMGIYAQDNPKCLEGLNRFVPSISKEEYMDHPFSYQALQKGCHPSWPMTYHAWKKTDSATSGFNKRKAIAAIFLENLIMETKNIR